RVRRQEHLLGQRAQKSVSGIRLDREEVVLRQIQSGDRQGRLLSCVDLGAVGTRLRARVNEISTKVCFGVGVPRQRNRLGGGQCWSGDQNGESDGRRDRAATHEARKLPQRH